jgi:DNA polymerase-1
VLEELALTHELPRLVLEWRALHKLKSTYIDALPVMVDPKTGRVHTSFNQAVAATGRLSSSDPNLQNIPIRTELGREIRRAFVAAPGHVLISADYSQIELRVLAHMAGEEALIEAFRNGEDIHERTGQKLFGVNNAMDKHQLRSLSKMVNYAVLYGKTPFTLAKDINVTQEAAQEFITAYFTGFPKVRGFIDRILEEGRTTGVVRTMFGRRRLVPNLTSRNFQMRSQAERETVNMPIQGTAADILKKAMIDLHAELPKRGLKTQMILTVHDELLFESRRKKPKRPRRSSATAWSTPPRSTCRSPWTSAWPRTGATRSRREFVISVALRGRTDMDKPERLSRAMRAGNRVQAANCDLSNPRETPASSREEPDRRRHLFRFISVVGWELQSHWFQNCPTE